MKWGVLVLAVACALVAVSGEAQADRIIAVADEWCTGSYFDRAGSSADVFAVNSFNWLTESSGNKSILIDSAYSVHNLTPLINTLAAAGFTVTQSNPSTWSAATFSAYGAVLWERGHGNGTDFDGSQLVQYIEGGGGVMLLGGGSGLALTQHNALLNEFGISELPYYNGYYTVTSFSPPHSVTTGVTTLYAAGPSPMTLLPGSTAEVLSNQHGVNWIVVAEVEGSPVPEPTTLALFGLGAGALALRRRKRMLA